LFALSNTSADRGAHTANTGPIPWPGARHRASAMTSRLYQVATASLTRDVVVRRWALDEQLTEDADGAGRQLKLARDHWCLSRIVAAPFRKR